MQTPKTTKPRIKALARSPRFHLSSGAIMYTALIRIKCLPQPMAGGGHVTNADFIAS